MGIFEKWDWIKRNSQYILEEAQKLDLVFVGGTALNLVLFDEYRASEDIDLYNPNPKEINNKGKTEEELAKELSKNLQDKGFEGIKLRGRQLYVGPNIKVEIFSNATPFKKVEKAKLEGIDILIFDLATYGQMKMTALLCRTEYDARDLVDLFVLHKKGNVKLAFPSCECDAIENRFAERINNIKETKKEDLRLFQNKEQIEKLPYEDFEKFKRWLVDWLSEYA
jgi:predicted nucleotidyltransferase component of viral defense system